jgi:hypothetical protein
MSDTIAPPAPPANVQEARTQLAAFVADKERGAKLFAGDVETNRQFSQLTAIASRDDDSTVAAAMAGKLGDRPDSTVRIFGENRGGGMSSKLNALTKIARAALANNFPEEFSALKKGEPVVYALLSKQRVSVLGKVRSEARSSPKKLSSRRDVRAKDRSR